MWINRDVDLPQALVSAQRDGRLVVFAGAGVSMGPPSNLPSFDSLAAAISGGALTRKEGEGLDAFLGRVEQHGVNIQASARQLIDIPASMPRGLHHLIVKLFRGESVLRIVTTNFDRHFTTAVRANYPQADIYTAPALPLGREWNGLIYLHGAVERSNSKLVLTDRDFGLGYLADGWATRFLMEMFREFAVLFIGYSHSDPVMRYLARSFVGGTARFALTLNDRDDHWVQLGIVPVHFPLRPPPDQFGAIDETVKDWTAVARMGAFDHRARIGRLVELPPPLDLENIDYLKAALFDRVTLQCFVEQASSVEWLRWAEAEGFLAPLIRRAPLDAVEPRLFAGWFAERFAVQHAREALAFVQQHFGTANAVLADAIAFQLAVRSVNVPREVLRLWATALVTADETPSRSLSRLLRKCAGEQDAETALMLFRGLLRPRLQFDPVWAAFDRDGPLALDAEVAFRGDAYELREVWGQTLRETIPTHYVELLPLITDWVHESFSLLRAAGRGGDDWDPMSNKRSAIEQHEQDHTSDDWGLAIDIARDVLDWVVEHEPEVAKATIESWYIARPLLLRRLAIYATARRTDISPSAALDLIEHHGWLYLSSLKHETFELLRAVFARADEAAQRRFIAHSMAANVLPDSVALDPEAAQTVAYERYNVAVWLRQIAPDSTIAAEHFGRLQQQHQEFGPREHPDMDHWISTGFVGPQSPMSTDELLAMSGDEAATYLIEYQPEAHSFQGPDRSGLITVLGQAAVASADWSLRVADALVARNTWSGELWAGLLGAWRSPSLTNDSWTRVLDLIDANPEIGAVSPLAAANFVEDSMDRKALSSDDLRRLEGIGERLLGQADAFPPGVTRNGDIEWLTSAINHPAGQVAMAWIKGVSKRMTAARDEWHGLPQESRGRFEALLGGVGNNAQLARVVFASQVHFLFSADRAWTEANIVPLFNWDADAVRAAQAWHGFLVWGRWNAALFECMKSFVVQTFGRMNDLGDEKRNFEIFLAGIAAYSQADPWHDNSWLFQYINVTGGEERAAWASEFGRITESLTVGGATTLWNSWVSDYWNSRVRGVPQPLTDVERQAMVTWVCAFKTEFAAAVTLVLAAPPVSLDHFTFYRLEQCRLAETHAVQLGRLLRGLAVTLNEVRYDTGELLELAISALDHGADRADMLAIAGEMLRLRCGDGVRLRSLAGGGPD